MDTVENTPQSQLTLLFLFWGVKVKLNTAKRIKKVLESRWKCTVHICKDWVNYLEIYPTETKLPHNRWILNMYLECIQECLQEPVIYVDFEKKCLVVYGKG
jgi:hypothetical protein